MRRVISYGLLSLTALVVLYMGYRILDSQPEQIHYQGDHYEVIVNKPQNLEYETPTGSPEEQAEAYKDIARKYLEAKK